MKAKRNTHRIALPHGNQMTTPAVHPQDWQTVKADTKKKWYIGFRFYEAGGTVKQIMYKGPINAYTALADRQLAVKYALEQIREDYKQRGYNPIKDAYFPVIEQNVAYEIDPYTDFIKALEKALERLKIVKATRYDIGSVIRGVNKAAKHLGYADIPICKITRKHIKLILECCYELNPRFSAHRFNLYKFYLSMLFNELVELEAAEYNPTRDIKPAREVKKTREVLGSEDLRDIMRKLKPIDYRYWRFLCIFFYSGRRITELLRLREDEIRLDVQKFKLTILKGKNRREEWCTIRNIAVPLWKEILTECKPGQFLFGKFLKPGKKHIGEQNIADRWKEYVKEGMGVTADVYTLKHTNLDEVAALLSLEDAQKMAGHTDEQTTRIYAINQAEREHLRLKRIANEL